MKITDVLSGASRHLKVFLVSSCVTSILAQVEGRKDRALCIDKKISQEKKNTPADVGEGFLGGRKCCKGAGEPDCSSDCVSCLQRVPSGSPS